MVGRGVAKRCEERLIKMTKLETRRTVKMVKGILLRTFHFNKNPACGGVFESEQIRIISIPLWHRLPRISSWQLQRPLSWHLPKRLQVSFRRGFWPRPNLDRF